MTAGNGDMTAKPAEETVEVVTPMTESEIQRTLANIHSVAKHLLHIEDGDQLYVGVHPTGRAWRVAVSYADFSLEVKESTLDAALKTVLQRLMGSVSRQLEESTRLIAALSPSEWSALGSRKSIEDVLRAIPEVAGFDLDEDGEPGVVDLRILPSGHITQEERDALCFKLGAVLEVVRPLPVRFNLRVIDTQYGEKRIDE